MQHEPKTIEEIEEDPDIGLSKPLKGPIISLPKQADPLWVEKAIEGHDIFDIKAP